MESLSQKEKREKLFKYIHSQVEGGRKVTEILNYIKVSRSSYYAWIKQDKPPRTAYKKDRRGGAVLAAFEEDLVKKVMESFPGLRHRQIQGMIQNVGHYLSPSSVYRYMKEKNLIEDFARRPSPLKNPTYSLFRKNMLWHLDWTKIKIGNDVFQFIAIIDGFSKMIMGWDVVRDVNSYDVVDLYMGAVEDENIEGALPRLRVDRGSPNTSKFTIRELENLGAEVSFAQVRRPTENAFIERFFGTLKQEEVYLVEYYPDEQTALDSLDNFIFYYNEIRPHQANYNFTPKKCHAVNNRSFLKKDLQELKEKSLAKRKEYFAVKSDYEFIQNWAKND